MSAAETTDQPAVSAPVVGVLTDIGPQQPSDSKHGPVSRRRPFDLVVVALLSATAVLTVGTSTPTPISDTPSFQAGQPTILDEPFFSTSQSVDPVRGGLLAHACDLNFQVPVAQGLGIAVGVSELTPSGSPPDAVCALWYAGLEDVQSRQDYLGNIHVFLPAAGEQLVERARALLSAEDIVQHQVRGRPFFVAPHLAAARYSGVLIGDSHYLVLVIVNRDTAIDNGAMLPLSRIADAVAKAIDSGVAGGKMGAVSRLSSESQ